MTRPEIPIDWKRVDELLEAGCFGTEIAANIGMHEDTFYRRVQEKFKVGFTEYSTQKRSRGDSLLKEAQFHKAVKNKDNTMLVWLGKQRLGQKETVSEFTVSQEVMKPFTEIMGQLLQMQQLKKVDEPTPKIE